MSSCCNGSQNRKVKEWGSGSKVSKFDNKTKLLITLGIVFVIVIGFLVFR